MLKTTNVGYAAYIKGTRRQRGGSLGENFAREVHPARHRAWSGRRLCLTGRLRRRRQQLRRRRLRWRELRRWRPLRRRGLRWRGLRWRLEGIVRRRCPGGRRGYRERVRSCARERLQVQGLGKSRCPGPPEERGLRGVL